VLGCYLNLGDTEFSSDRLGWMSNLPPFCLWRRWIAYSTFSRVALCINFYRATRSHSADCAVARCPLSHADTVSKRLRILSNFLHRRVYIATTFYSFRTIRHSNIPTKTSLTGASNAGSIKEIAIFDQYLSSSPKW